VKFVVAALVIFHTPDGHEVAINPYHVTNIVAAKDEKNKLFVDGVKCLINLTNGKFITVAESCDRVKARLEAAK
jgi:uncharacterized protein YlzI (FlbEa/FlbD family)